jgi:sec-independent protein translocase protein TatA
MFMEATTTTAGLLAWSPGWPEIVVILIAMLLLFGGKKLPELARGLGKGMRQFKRELNGLQDDMDVDVDKLDREEPTSESGKSKQKTAAHSKGE